MDIPCYIIHIPYTILKKSDDNFFNTYAIKDCEFQFRSNI